MGTGVFQTEWSNSSLVQVWLTVNGHVRIAEESANTDASQAFVAMWFDDSVESAYDDGIAPAIRDCGFEPKRIDRDPTIDKIDDAIIAEIRRSRFRRANLARAHHTGAGERVFCRPLGLPTTPSPHCWPLGGVRKVAVGNGEHRQQAGGTKAQ